MFYNCWLHIVLWAAHNVAYTSLEHMTSNQQDTSCALNHSSEKSECVDVKPGANRHNFTHLKICPCTTGNPQDSCATSCFCNRYACLYENFKKDVRTPCISPYITVWPESAQPHLDTLAIPVPEICKYLQNNLELLASKKPPNRHMDCPSKHPLVWDINLFSPSSSAYYNASQNLSASNMLNNGKIRDQSHMCVSAQTKYINYLLARAKTNSVIPEIDYEADRLYGQIKLNMENMYFRRELLIHFGAQLLVSGLYSYITNDIAAALNTLSVLDATYLICYMLDPAHNSRFPAFISALYFFLCDGDLTSESARRMAVQVLASWKCAIHDIVPKLTQEERITACRATMEVARHRLQDACAAGLLLEKEAHAQYAGALSVYWHAVFSAVELAAAPVKTSMPAGVLDEIAIDLAELIQCPASYTAPWGYWEPLLTALSTLLPETVFHAFVIARTPPALAGRVLQSTAITGQARMVIATFWLALLTPQMHSVLESTPILLVTLNYRHMCLLLQRLPITTLARISSKNIDKILLYFVFFPEASKVAHWVSKNSAQATRDKHENQDGQVSKSSGNRDMQAEPPDSELQQIADMFTNSTRRRLRMSNRATRRSAGGLLAKLLLLRNATTDLSEKIIDYFFADTSTVRILSSTIDDMATEQPVWSHPSFITRYDSRAERLLMELLEIFTGKDVSDESAQSTRTPKLGRLKPQQSGTNDISWLMHKKSMPYFQVLAPFIFRQVLPRLANYISSNMYMNSYHQHITAVAHLLGVYWFREWLAALESVLIQIGIEIQDYEFHVQRWAAAAQLQTDSSASQPDGAAPAAEAYHLVFKVQQDTALPLSLAEQRVRALLPDSPLTVRAYIDIAASLERLAVAVLGYTDYTRSKSTYERDMRFLLERIVGFRLLELPFIFVPVTEATAPWNAAAALRQERTLHTVCHVQYTEDLFKTAMCSVCYHYILTLDRFQEERTTVHFDSVYSWCAIFVWLYSHPLAKECWDKVAAATHGQYSTDLALNRRQIDQVHDRFLIDKRNGAVSTVLYVDMLKQSLRYICVKLEGCTKRYRRNRDRLIISTEIFYSQSFTLNRKDRERPAMVAGASKITGARKRNRKASEATGTISTLKPAV